ncbi:oxidoreductase [Nocardia sp. BMG51109]|uniref:oxidoreductase n=1 Tax=Nocardia sp. BMG51109 TaxID=1056816 RepID=UPI00046565D5|nr:oxidoreductase [Nocardia sp. BMG51109]
MSVATTRWTASDLPSLAGRTVVITGANSGLGLVAARELARVGSRVVLAVRDPDRGAAAAATIYGKTEVRPLDLGNLESVRRFADGWSGEIDVLINNAGIMMVPLGRTADGFESQLGVNHFGHFALTNLLLPHITDRVVTVSSQAHRRGAIDLDDLNWERRPYDRSGAYGQSKLANLLFGLELHRRLQAAGSPVRSVNAHPGYAATNLQSHSGDRILHFTMAIANRLVAQSAKAGARPLLYAASQDIPSGSYVGPDGPYQWRGYPDLVDRSAAAQDMTLAERVWDVSEKSTGVAFPEELQAR